MAPNEDEHTLIGVVTDILSIEGHVGAERLVGCGNQRIKRD